MPSLLSYVASLRFGKAVLFVNATDRVLWALDENKGGPARFCGSAQPRRNLLKVDLEIYTYLHAFILETTF